MFIKIMNTVNGTIIAEKNSHYIPRKNENLRIDGKSYEVAEVMNDFDEKCVYIAVSPSVQMSYVNHFQKEEEICIKKQMVRD